MKKPRQLSLKIVPEEFTAPGAWRVVKAPSEAVPQLEAGVQPIEVQIARK